MCTHRAVSRWHRFWSWFARIALVGFLAPEMYGLATVGPDATFSAFCWHSIGLREPCRHTPLGRTAIVAVGLWLIAHLGWGRLGFAPSCRRFRRRNP